MAEVQDNLSTSRKTASVAILVTLAFLSGYATSLLLNQIIPAGVSVTVRSDEGFLRAYWDPARTQLVSSIDFGDVRQGDSSSVNLYIFNENATSSTTANWSSDIIEATDGSITDLMFVDGADLRGMEIPANSYAYATYTIQVRLAAVARRYDWTLSIGTGLPVPEEYSFQFSTTDAVFDPARQYLYVSDKYARSVHFVNLITGSIEQTFDFFYMPESLAITPDGSSLFVALLTREHDPYWFDEAGHVGYVSVLDLNARAKDREFRINEDPFDMVATSNGQLVVSSGSGQWTYIRVYDVQTGDELGASYPIRHMSKLTLHPSEAMIYAADTDLSPSDITRYNLSPEGAITRVGDSPYHGDHRMGGNVWASPRGDVLVTRGGDVFTAGSARENDMVYVASMAPQTINDLSFDLSRNIILSAEGMAIRYYNITNYELRGTITFEVSVDFVGTDGFSVFALDVQTSRTYILVRDHPLLMAREGQP